MGVKKTSTGLAGFISGAKTCAISHFFHTNETGMWMLPFVAVSGGLPNVDNWIEGRWGSNIWKKKHRLAQLRNTLQTFLWAPCGYDFFSSVARPGPWIQSRKVEGGNGFVMDSPRGAPVIAFFVQKRTKKQTEKKNMKWTNGAISMYHRAKKNVFLESVSFLDDMEV